MNSGKYLIIIGGIILLLGIYLYFGGKLPPLFRLPGDIVYKGENTTIFIPITTMIIISLILNLILKIFK
ncbi:DUF2905 domain-containing protein [Anaerobranca gottschalkii]|uniref:DUF2905 domain-containing protein n=1 Tax=Anaerobranca gottschalkii DSM 13577 TaxID=1120990 RepID=A0A1I0BHX2_9FIRM|nr:DUF2905 domain-containing protein [Anaerobranca gottschalkii]SET06407.1 Protein of unknown function [Anaerobranca gottschalkii DSM 13577]